MLEGLVQHDHPLTLQHILEGYKVADAIKQHGAGASSFSDWWAYKFEVYDAIPYNGAVLRDAGVTVSFNSDDNELARRLNLEAAKGLLSSANRVLGLLAAVALMLAALWLWRHNRRRGED